MTIENILRLLFSQIDMKRNLLPLLLTANWAGLLFSMMLGCQRR
ncbi:MULTISPECIES: hypothetical protein [unclassified Bartonella]|nr:MULTISPECIES: hypothetical protein [unclassified Bartonella]UXN02523.1 hypothetical protein N6B01_08515 [Bartonella sp. HY406]